MTSDPVTRILEHLAAAPRDVDPRGYSNCPVCAEVILPSWQGRYEGACCADHGAIVLLERERDEARAEVERLRGTIEPGLAPALSVAP